MTAHSLAGNSGHVVPDFYVLADRAKSRLARSKQPRAAQEAAPALEEGLSSPR